MSVLYGTKINQKYILMHNYQPKNLPTSSQVFSQSDFPHNVRLWLKNSCVLSVYNIIKDKGKGFPNWL